MQPAAVLLFWDRDGDVAVGNDAVVVSLQVERSRLGLVAIESAAGGSGEFDIVVIYLAVAQNRNMPAD